MCETGSLALFGLKQTSLDEICNRLHKKKNQLRLQMSKEAASTEQQSLTVLFYLVAALQQHPGRGELVDGVQVKCT